MSLSPDHESLFKTWLEEHQGIVVKIARSFTSTPMDCDELQQELLLQLWISAKSFTGQAKASTWIYRVCLNTALTWRRGTERRERRIDSTADVAQMVTATCSPADSVSEREMLDHLYLGIRALKEGDRALVLLSLDEVTYREIAEITGLTENHVGVALTRARKRLADLLKGVTNELK
mgnify:CR=1 FL=1